VKAFEVWKNAEPVERINKDLYSPRKKLKTVTKLDDTIDEATVSPKSSKKDKKSLSPKVLSPK